jgi:N-acyl amino acid synthase of PEP-CTERM/exosortase system
MACPDMQELVRSYASHFTVVQADTPALRDEAYRLRYQVYCLENTDFENPDEHQDGRECDCDDDRSIHALLMHRRTGMYAGTVRVVLPSSSRPLPVHNLLEAQDENLLSQLPARRELAEISRFAVSKEFRRRRGEERYPDVSAGSCGPNMSDERRVLPFITFGLLRGVLEICLEHRVPWIAAVMEPALLRIFDRFGVNFERIGMPVEHHGTRWCCVARITDLVNHGHTHGTPLSHYAHQYDRSSAASKYGKVSVAA